MIYTGRRIASPLRGLNGAIGPDEPTSFILFRMTTFAGRVTRRVRGHPVDAGCLALLLVAVLLYIVAYSSKSINHYRIGVTLFDLAVFDQSFWNATQGTLFYTSLEGEISHFGRHFSPIFFLLLPFYALRPDPTTLLVLQSVALGLAAIPLWLITRMRVGHPLPALVAGLVYLASPVVHDINIVNEFHEVAFAIPLLFLAFLALETERWRLYWVAVIGSLMVKEDVALIVAALGLYVAFAAGHRRTGLATLATAAVWFVVVVELVMPALRGSLGPVPFVGYEYLGEGIFGIARGIVTKPGELLEVMTSAPKREFLKWLFLPVGFLALLAPRVLFIALPGLFLILASTNPSTYAVFERYIAPALPFIFIAAIVGVARLAGWGERLFRRTGRFGADGRWQHACVALAVLPLLAGTLYSQQQLDKRPESLLVRGEPSPHAALAMQLAGAIPSGASVVIEDHRLLDRASQRRDLFYLSGRSPYADYVLVDRRVAPITHIPAEDRSRFIETVVRSGDYQPVYCRDGLALYGQNQRSAQVDPPPYNPEHELSEPFGNQLLLRGYDLYLPPADQAWDAARLTLYWENLDTRPDLDWQVIIQFRDGAGEPVLEHRETFGRSCATADWPVGLVLTSWHQVPLSEALLGVLDSVAVLVADEGGMIIGHPVVVGP